MVVIKEAINRNLQYDCKGVQDNVVTKEFRLYLLTNQLYEKNILKLDSNFRLLNIKYGTLQTYIKANLQTVNQHHDSIDNRGKCNN